MEEPIKKKNQFILVPILAAIVCVVIIYLFFFVKGKSYPSAGMALPASALMVYEGQKPEESFARLRGTDIYKFLEANATLNKFGQDFDFYESLFSKSDKLKALLAKNPLIASLHFTGANNADLLFLNQTEEKYTRDEFYKFFKDLNKDLDFSERNFDGTSIYDAKDAGKNDVFSFALIHGIFALSKNSALVEDAIHAYDANKSKSPAFIDSVSAADKRERIFINFRNIGTALAPFVQPNYRDAVNGLKDYIGFGSYILDAENNGFTLKGTIAGDENCFLPAAFKESNTNENSILDMIPARSSVVMEWSVNDFAKYEKAYLAFRTKTSGKDYDDAWKRYQSEFKFSDETFFKLFKGEWAYVLPEAPSESDTLSPLLICKIDSNAYGIMDSINRDPHKSEINYTNYSGPKAGPIHRSQLKNMTGLLFGNLFSGIIDPYYTRIGEYMVFANTSEGIINFVNDNITGHSIKTSSGWKSVAEKTDTKGNFFLYMNPADVSALGGKMTVSENRDDYKNNIALINGLDALFFTAGNANSSVVLSRTSRESREVESSWETALGAEAASPPQLIHNSDNSDVIFISDKDNNAYLINSSGRVLWKKIMDEPLSGTAAPIDLFDNGITEYLFASKNTLYLLDKEGKDAGNYPLHLGSRSTSGVALFDFNANHNYTYFVGTQNNRIYGYNGNGKPLPGWNPQMIDAPLVMPLQSFNVKGDIYLMGVSNRGTVYVWRPDGDRTIKPVELKTRFSNPFKFTSGKKLSDFSFVSVDTNGVLHRVTMEREITKRNYSTTDGKVFFEMADLDSNGKEQYIISNGKNISGYEKDKKKWKIKTDHSLEYAPQLYPVDGHTWIGYVDAEKNKIYLVNHEGRKYRGFPLEGTMPFIIHDFNNDGSLELITVSKGRKVKMYKL